MSVNPKEIAGSKKPPLRLVPPVTAILQSRVMELGAGKYGPYNWREEPIRLSFYLEAILRHTLAKLDGENLDSESGMPHEAHVLADCSIILDALTAGTLIDDRPPAGGAAEVLLALMSGRSMEERREFFEKLHAKAKAMNDAQG